jgi:hypothetical protein
MERLSVLSVPKSGFEKDRNVVASLIVSIRSSKQIKSKPRFVERSLEQEYIIFQNAIIFRLVKCRNFTIGIY